MSAPKSKTCGTCKHWSDYGYCCYGNETYGMRADKDHSCTLHEPKKTEKRKD